MTVLKETLCSSCEHVQVCSLKHTFLKVLEKADGISVGTEDNGIIRVVDIPWLNINLSCSDFQTKTNMRKGEYREYRKELPYEN